MNTKKTILTHEYFLFLLYQDKRKESIKNKKRLIAAQALLFVSFKITDSRTPINY